MLQGTPYVFEAGTFVGEVLLDISDLAARQPIFDGQQLLQAGDRVGGKDVSSLPVICIERGTRADGARRHRGRTEDIATHTHNPTIDIT